MLQAILTADQHTSRLDNDLYLPSVSTFLTICQIWAHESMHKIALVKSYY